MNKKIIIIIILALLLRLIFWYFNPVVETDSPAYIEIGINLLKGNGYLDNEGNINTVLPPLYSICIGILYLIIKNAEIAGKLISIIAGSLLILPIYYLAKALFNRKIALLASLFTALYPALIQISTVAYTDSLFLLFLFTSLLAMWHTLNKQKSLYLILTGILMGLATLVRPEGIGLIGILFITLLLFKYLNKDYKIFKKFIIPLLLLIIVLTPYQIFLYSQTQEFLFSGKTAPNLFYNPEDQNAEMDRYSINENKNDLIYNPYNNSIKLSLIQIILQDPIGFISKYFKNFYKASTNIIPTLFPIILLIVASIGLFSYRWNKEEKKSNSFLLITIFYFTLLYPIFYISVRHFLPIVPILIIFLAIGTYKMSKIYRINKKYITVPVVMILLLGTVFLISFPPFENEGRAIEHKEAGLWLKENSQNPVVMSRKPWVSFYANGKFEMVPYATYEETIGYAKLKNVDYVVIDERYIPETRPSLKFLLNEKNTEDLVLVYINNNHRHKILLYRME